MTNLIKKVQQNKGIMIHWACIYILDRVAARTFVRKCYLNGAEWWQGPAKWMGKNNLEGNNFNPERRMSLVTSQIAKGAPWEKW